MQEDGQYLRFGSLIDELPSWRWVFFNSRVKSLILISTCVGNSGQSKVSMSLPSYWNGACAIDVVSSIAPATRMTLWASGRGYGTCKLQGLTI